MYGEKRTAYRVLTGNWETHNVDLDIDRMIKEVGLDSSGSEERQVVGPC